MKKATTFAVMTALICALMGCGNFEIGATPESETETVSENAPAEASIDMSSLTDDEFVYNGHAISILNTMDSLFEAMGKPETETHEAGINVYSYNKYSVYINSMDENGADCPYSIIISDKNAMTARGIKVGSSKEDIINAYGEPTEAYEYEDQSHSSPVNSMIYKFDNDKYQIGFSVVEGKVEQFNFLRP